MSFFSRGTLKSVPNNTVLGNQDQDNDEKLDNFFTTLNLREEQYFKAKKRYEEALDNFEKILNDKKTRFGHTGEIVKPTPVITIEAPQPAQEKKVIVSGEKPVKRKYRNRWGVLNKNSLPDDIIEVLKYSENMTVKDILAALIKNGRNFTSQRPYNVVQQALNRNTSGRFIRIGKKWSLK